MYKTSGKISRNWLFLICFLVAMEINGSDLKKTEVNIAEVNLQKGREFLELNKKNKGVIVRASGLQYQIMKEGNGSKPRLIDSVEVHYHGTLINGRVFDSSVDRGVSITFPVRHVIRGWTEALLLMSEGSKWKLFIPSNLAYGEKGSGDMIGPNETLIFEVELIKVEK